MNKKLRKFIEEFRVKAASSWASYGGVRKRSPTTWDGVHQHSVSVLFKVFVVVVVSSFEFA